MAAIWFLLFDKCKAIIKARSLGVGIPEQEDVPVFQTIGKNDWKSEGLAMLKKRHRDTSTKRTTFAAMNASKSRLVVAATTVAGVLWVIVYQVRSLPAPAQPAIPLQEHERSLAQTDDSEPLSLGSVFGCNSPAPPPASISLGRSSPETGTPDLSTPAATVYSVLSLIDQGATGKLAPCLFKEAAEPVSRLYPRYLGPPVGLGEVIEEDQAARVVWDATVRRGFSWRGRHWAPGETITLTARLVRGEGLWKLLQLHEGDKDGLQSQDATAN